MGCAYGLGDVLVFEPDIFRRRGGPEVCEEADDQQAGHDVQDERIGFCLGMLVAT